MWLIYVVMLLYGVSLVVIDPAENALFAVMLPEDIRQRVNGMGFALQEGGKLVARFAGAGLSAALTLVLFAPQPVAQALGSAAIEQAQAGAPTPRWTWPPQVRRRGARAARRRCRWGRGRPRVRW